MLEHGLAGCGESGVRRTVLIVLLVIGVMRKSNTDKRVLVVANVSAGKSSLINSLVGKKVCKSTNLVCTSKLVKIKLHYGKQHIYEYQKGNSVANISLRGRNVTEIGFDSIKLYGEGSLCRHNVIFIDSPGTNNATTKEHERITLDAIKGNEYDLLVYVSNATNQMTDDERYLLDYVRDNCKRKIVVVVNKIDELKKEEPIEDYVNRFNDDLQLNSIYPEAIIPVSVLGYEVLKNKEDENYDFFLRKFKNKEKNLPQYAICWDSNINNIRKNGTSVRNRTGVPFLRAAICKVLERL